MMENLKQWILAEAGDEQIIGVVIGEMGWGDYGSKDVPNYESQPKNKVISWQVAESYLDYEFDSGFGAPGCNAVFVWTVSKVIFISQYDGATSRCSVPRNPIDCVPIMPGG